MKKTTYSTFMFFTAFLIFSCGKIPSDSLILEGSSSGNELTGVMIKNGSNGNMFPKSIILSPNESIEVKYQIKNDKTGKIETYIPELFLESYGTPSNYIKLDKNIVRGLDIPDNKIYSYNLVWNKNLLINGKYIKITTRSSSSEKEFIPVFITKNKIKSIMSNIPDFIKQNDSPSYSSISSYKDIYDIKPVKIDGKINYYNGDSSEKGLIWFKSPSEEEYSGNRISIFDPSTNIDKSSYGYSSMDKDKLKEYLDISNKSKNIDFKERLESYITPSYAGFTEIIGIPIEYFLLILKENNNYTRDLSINDFDYYGSKEGVKKYIELDLPIIKTKINVTPNKLNYQSLPNDQKLEGRQKKVDVYANSFGAKNIEASSNQSGDIAFVWISDYKPNTTTDLSGVRKNLGVYARVLLKDGKFKTLSEFIVNDSDLVGEYKDITDPNIAINESGNIVVSWIENHEDLYIRSFSQDGKPITEKILVTHDSQKISFPRISLNNNNKFVIAWKSMKNLNNKNSIYYSDNKNKNLYFSDVEKYFFTPATVYFKTMDFNGQKNTENLLISDNLDLGDIFINQKNEVIISCRVFNQDKDYFDSSFIRKYSIDGNYINTKFLENSICQNTKKRTNSSFSKKDCMSKPELSINKDSMILVHWFNLSDDYKNKSYVYLQRFNNNFDEIDSKPIVFSDRSNYGFPKYASEVNDNTFNGFENYNKIKLFDDSSFSLVSYFDVKNKKNETLYPSIILNFDKNGVFSTYYKNYIDTYEKKYFIEKDKITYIDNYPSFEVEVLNDKKDN